METITIPISENRRFNIKLAEALPTYNRGFKRFLILPIFAIQTSKNSWRRQMEVKMTVFVAGTAEWPKTEEKVETQNTFAFF